MMSTTPPPPPTGDTPLASGEGAPAAEPAPAPMPAPTPEAAPSDALPVWPEITHALRFPLPVAGGEPIKSITVREPDLETMERVLAAVQKLGLTDDNAALGVAQLRPMLAALTGIPDESLKRLHYKDVTALSEKLAPFFEGLTS